MNDAAYQPCRRSAGVPPASSPGVSPGEPSLSPAGGEGARRAGEGDSQRHTAPVGGQETAEAPQVAASRPPPGGAEEADGQAGGDAAPAPAGCRFTAAVGEVASGFYSLVSGLGVTLAEFFKPTVTVHYPHESLKMPERFRGHVELARDPATGQSLCVACKSCQKACPSGCILVEGAKREGEKRRSPVVFKLDFTKCSLCGACVEVCATGALRFSKEYNLASTDKNAYFFDLLKRLQAEKK